MRVKTIQIVWHGTENGKEPVYSLDFHPNGMLLTAGGDKEIKTWKVEKGDDGYPVVTFTASLSGHSKTVNCTRISPSGKYMVSSGDGVEMLLWKASETEMPQGNLEETRTAPWRRVAVLRGHNDDIMDICWSHDGTALVSGSIDNKSIIWDMRDDKKRQGLMLHQLKEHRHYTQGVAWDPAQQFIVTQSADRTCTVHAMRPPAAGKKSRGQQQLHLACNTAKEFHAHKFLKKQRLRNNVDGLNVSDKIALFQDEGIPSFFRRLSWSPDGSFLVVPAGQHKSSSDSKMVNTAFIYARNNWSTPLIHLPGHAKPVIAVRFCPVIFRSENCTFPQQKLEQKACPKYVSFPASAAATVDVNAELEQELQEASRGLKPNMPFELPYKMVFAVATLDSVVLYSTDSLLPLAVIGQLHYDSITDLAWSSDGGYLAVSSRDCYCSIAAFEPGELGTPMPAEELPPHIAARMASAKRTAFPTMVSQSKAGKAHHPDVTPLCQRAGEELKASVAVPEQLSAEQQLQSAGTTAGTREQQGSLAAQQAQSKLKERRRIQAEPVLPARQHHSISSMVLKRKRITPEAVGPASAVVGDSQGGTQIFPGLNLEVTMPEKECQPAVKAARRIVPMLIPEKRAVHDQAKASIWHEEQPTSLDAAARQGEAQVPAESKLSPSGGSAVVAKTVKRITPILVQPSPAQPIGPGQSRPEPSSTGGAVMKPPKRITPTPMKGTGSGSDRFETAKQVLYAAPASEASTDGYGAGFHRRTTPAPAAGLSAPSDIIDDRSHAGKVVEAAVSKLPKLADIGSTGFSVAALAMAAGQRAAAQEKRI